MFLFLEIQHVSIFDSIPVPAFHKNVASSSFATSSTASASASSSSASAHSAAASSSASTLFEPHEVLEKIILHPTSFVWRPTLHLQKLTDSVSNIENSEGFTSSASASASASSASTSSASTVNVHSSEAGSNVLPVKISLHPLNVFPDTSLLPQHVGNAHKGNTALKTTKISLNPSNVFLYGSAMDLDNVGTSASSSASTSTSTSSASSSVGSFGSTSTSSVNIPVPPVKVNLNPSNVFLYSPEVDLKKASMHHKDSETTSTLNLDSTSSENMSAVSSASSSNAGSHSTSHVSMTTSPTPKPVKITLNPSNVFLFGPAMELKQPSVSMKEMTILESNMQHGDNTHLQASTATSISGTSTAASAVSSTMGNTIPTKIHLNPANPFLYGPEMDLTKTASFNNKDNDAEISQVHVVNGGNFATATATSTASDGSAHSFVEVQPLHNTGTSETIYSNLDGSGVTFSKVAQEETHGHGFGGNLATATSTAFDGSAHSFTEVQPLHNTETSETTYSNLDGSGLSFSKVVQGPTYGHGYAGAIAVGEGAQVQAASGYDGLTGSGSAVASSSSTSGTSTSASKTTSSSSSASSFSHNYDQTHAHDLERNRHHVIILDRGDSHYNDHLNPYETEYVYGDHEHGFTSLQPSQTQAYFDTADSHHSHQVGGNLYHVLQSGHLFRSDDDDEIVATHEHEISDSEEHEDGLSSSTYGIAYDDFGPRRSNIEENSASIEISENTADNSESVLKKFLITDGNKHEIQSVKFENLNFDKEAAVPLVNTKLLHTKTEHVESSSSKSSHTNETSQSSKTSFAKHLGDGHVETAHTEHTSTSSSSSSTSSNSSSSSSKTIKEEHILI